MRLAEASGGTSSGLPHTMTAGKRSMERTEILRAAADIVAGKDAAHGEIESSFGKIAAMWSAYLDVPVEPKDVAAMMILLKAARVSSGHQIDDNWTDICGYAACGGELEAAAAEAGIDAGYQD